jgi:hypothetical protein
MTLPSMKKVVLTAIVAAVLGVAASPPANAGVRLQGPRLTGIALQFMASGHPVPIGVTLPLAESVDLRRRSTDTTNRRR